MKHLQQDINTMTHAKKGFTLTELLITISIIGLFASIVLVAVDSAGKKSRDSVRKSDILQLEKALEFHYDKYGSYTQPETQTNDTSSSCADSSGRGAWCAGSDLQILITDDMIERISKDPINSGAFRYTYEPWDAGQGGYARAGQAYDLCATLEQGGLFCVNKRN